MMGSISHQSMHFSKTKDEIEALIKERRVVAEKERKLREEAAEKERKEAAERERKKKEITL